MGIILTSGVEDAGMEAIKAGGTAAIEFMTTAFTAMTSNVYLAVFLGVTMIGAGVGLFRKLRRGT